MNHALPRHTTLATAQTTTLDHDELAGVRRLRSLLALFALYATALATVIVVSDGADIGCILAGIAGHVVYATCRIFAEWRDASWLEHAARARATARATS